MVMIIKGTEKIKGVIDLSSIKLQLKKGTVYSISDKDYWNSDVQSAIRMGFLTSAGDAKNSEESESKVVRCINIYSRPLNINSVSKSSIMPNHSFTIPEEMLDHPDIRAARERGMIQVTQIVDPSDYSEGFLKIGEIFEEEEEKKRADKKKEAQLFKSQINRTKDEMQKSIELETNEALPTLTNVSTKPSLKDAIRSKTSDEINEESRQEKKSMTSVIDESNPEPVKATDDEKRKVLFVDPNQNSSSKPKQAHIHDPSSKSTIDTENPKAVKSEYDSKPIVSNTKNKEVQKQGIVWNPARAPIQKISARDENEDILFADKETEKERLAKHPVLGNKPRVEQVDDPIIPDSLDENRISKHPILGKKQSE